MLHLRLGAHSESHRKPVGVESKTTGPDPFRIAEVDAIGAGIHAIRAGRH